MNWKLCITFLLIVSIKPILSAQLLNHIQGDVIVRMQDKENPREWLKDFEYFDGQLTNIQYKRSVSPYMGIFLYSFDYTVINELDLLETIRKHPAVMEAQLNHRVKGRETIPNDPEFTNQWQYINTGQNGGQMGADLDMGTCLGYHYRRYYA